ncbi:hypothetical protein ES703_45203 [subsurface metagenome]
MGANGGSKRLKHHCAKQGSRDHPGWCGVSYCVMLAYSHPFPLHNISPRGDSPPLFSPASSPPHTISFRGVKKNRGILHKYSVVTASHISYCSQSSQHFGVRSAHPGGSLRSLHHPEGSVLSVLWLASFHFGWLAVALVRLWLLEVSCVGVRSVSVGSGGGCRSGVFCSVGV